MKQELLLHVKNNSIKAQRFSNDFLIDITSSSELLLKDETFLNTEESEVLFNNFKGEIFIINEDAFKEKPSLLTRIWTFFDKKEPKDPKIKPVDEFVSISYKLRDRERNPQLLLDTLKKVQQYLFDYQDTLPVVHKVYKDASLRKELEHVRIKGKNGYIDGDLSLYDNYETLRNKISISIYHDEFSDEAEELLIEVAPKITIGNKVYYTTTITKYKQHKADFERCYQFLQIAINRNKRVLWEMIEN